MNLVFIILVMLEMLKKNKRFISSSFMAVTIYFAASFFDPYVTVYLLEKGFSKQAITLITSLAPLSLVIFPPILGKLSDVLGRRRVASIGILLFLASQFLYLYVGNIYLYLILATIAAYVGFEGTVGTLLARTEDGASKHRGIITGLFESLKHIGYLSGIALGAIALNYSGIEGNIKISIYILIFLFIFNNIRPNHNHNKPCLKDFNPLEDVKDFLKIPELRPMAILGYTVNFTAATRTIIMPLLVIEVLKIDIKYIGLYLGALSAGHLFQFIFGYLCEKFSHIKIINTSNIIFAFATLGLCFVANGFQLLAVGIVAGLSLAAWNTSAWTHMSEIGEKYHEEGNVVGSFMSFASLGSFTGYLLSSYLVTNSSPRLIFLIFAIIVLVGVAISNIYFKKYRYIR